MPRGDAPLAQLLRRWAAARAERDALAAAVDDPLQAVLLAAAVADCEAAADAWEAAVCGGTMRQRYSASGRDWQPPRADCHGDRD